MNRYIQRLLFLIILLSITGFASELDSVVLKDEPVLLLNTRSTSRVGNGDSLIYLYFGFSDSCPNYFYEISQTEKKIVFTFVNTRLDGFSKEDTAKQINLGPIKTMYLKEQIKNKNEAVNGLEPEWYSVTTMTLLCDPVIKDEKSFDIVEKDQTLSITVKWPAKHADRKVLYSFPKKKRTALKLTLTGVGVAGLAVGGYLLYHFLASDKNDSPDMLQPVLPEHPVIE